MVFQKKGGFKGKQQTPAKQKGKKSMNSGMGSFFEQESDDSENEQIVKTPGGKTPKGKQAQADKRVSFQIPGKNTPNKTPKNENSVVKKTPTPAKPSALKEFKGLQQNNSKKNNKPLKKPADDDDDDDDDEDDDDDDDEDIDLDMLGDDDDDDDDDEEDSEDEGGKPKKMQQKQMNSSQMKQKSSKKSDDDDDDDDDDEDMDMDMLLGGDDDDDDDDSEDDSEEEKPQQIKQKNQMNTSQQKPIQENKTPSKKEKSPVKKDQKTPQTSLQTMTSPKKSEKKVEKPAGIQKAMELGEERKRERDVRTLFVGNLPNDISPSELKALSVDILTVNIPQLHNKKRNKSLFAFLEFLNEAKAEENFELLKSKKLRGQPLKIDFTGSKRKNSAQKEDSTTNVNLKKLFVSSISVDTTIDKIAALFPKSNQITLNISAAYRSAAVNFVTEKDAAEALEKSKNAKIEGKPLTVLYSIARDRSKRKRPNNKKGKQNAAAKKMKMEVKKESDDDDDDDDDDDEE